jgi:hypothetical protein
MSMRRIVGTRVGSDCAVKAYGTPPSPYIARLLSSSLLTASSSRSLSAPPSPSHCFAVRRRPIFYANASRRRSLGSSVDVANNEEASSVTSSSTQLPMPPMTPAIPTSFRSLVTSTHLLTSLLMLPECRNAINLLNDGPTSNEDGTVEIRRAHVDLARAKEILMQYSQYEVAYTIDLLECDLCCSIGNFDKALVYLSRYEYHSYKKTAATTTKTTPTRRKSRMVLQFEKARLLVSSGKFHEALSEYEDLLERMEIEVQERIEMKKMDNNGRRSNTNKSDDDEEHDILPVIDAVSAVTGVGITKLLLHLRSSSLVSSNNIGGGDVDEIIESLDTATEMLVESRKDALLSPIHYQLAVDLGLAASISLTNAGVAHCLLSSRRSQHDDNDHHHNRAMELWKEGLATLDMILVDAANSLVVIPRHKFICMESVRARLYCNISCTLLGLYSSSLEDPPKKLSDDILKEASDAAKKALDIYDELMNGSKFLRDDGSSVNDGGGSAVDDGPSSSSEWEEILREQAATTIDGASAKPPEVPLSSIGMVYHKCESARALGLLARCYALAGSAVSAEGLFQSAMDASSSHPFGRKIRSTSSDDSGDAITRNDDDDERIIEKGVSVSSANLSLIARDVRLWKAMLYDDWDKRERDADRLRRDALLIENDCTSLKGYVRDKEGIKQFVSGLEASLYLFSPSNFK